MLGEKSKLDLSTVVGLAVGLGGILGGLALEGGKISDIAQGTGALIVFGGTIGAVLITTPVPAVLRALQSIRLLLLQPVYSAPAVVESLIEFGNRARRNGIVSLEQDLEHVTDPFLHKALALGVDGTDLEEIRTTMELEIALEEEDARTSAKVFDAAGGYSPTIGIIGAVLGLIQVMKHLDKIDEVGHGIAVAFVATVYGVGAANLLFLPAAGKLRSRAEQKTRMRELMLEGVCAIVQGLHPKVIERKLEAYVRHQRARPAGTHSAGVRTRARVPSEA